MFVTHSFCTPDIGLSHQYQVSWLLCTGRLVSKADNVIYNNAHTFCWMFGVPQLIIAIMRGEILGTCQTSYCIEVSVMKIEYQGQ